MAKKYEKGRYWGFVGYPESMPSNWQDIIVESGLQCAVSPLHDNDFDPTGEVKKEHYHFIVIYDGPTTKNNVEEFCKKINATIPIKLESIRGMYRYHIHIDNPDKFQYDDRDRQFFNGFDVHAVNELTKTEVNKIKKEIISFINDHDILEYADLITILLENECNELLDVASSHTILFNTYITSKRHSYERNSQKSITSDNIYYVNSNDLFI